MFVSLGYIFIAFKKINSFSTFPSYSFHRHNSIVKNYQRRNVDYGVGDLQLSSSNTGLFREKILTQHHCHIDTVNIEKTSSVNTITDANDKKSDDIGMVSIAGIDPDDATKRNNQDSSFYFTHFVYIQEKYYKLTCVGVLDGHGKKGHIVSNYFSAQIPELFVGNNAFKHNDNNNATTAMDNINITNITQNACVYAFEQSHKNACSDSSIPSGRSGTTCIMTVLIEAPEEENGLKILVTANVGDSRAIIGYNSAFKNNIGSSSNNDLIQLSQETTIKQSKERKRIESSKGGRIVQGNVFYGPLGISMTRALGDSFMINAGVISTPDVRTYNIRDIIIKNNLKKSSNIAVVLGSDGVFDVLNNSHVMELVMDKVNSGSLKEAAELVGDKALQKWKDGLPLDVRVDDITCIVLKIA